MAEVTLKTGRTVTILDGIKPELVRRFRYCASLIDGQSGRWREGCDLLVWQLVCIEAEIQKCLSEINRNGRNRRRANALNQARTHFRTAVQACGLTANTLDWPLIEPKPANKPITAICARHGVSLREVGC